MAAKHRHKLPQTGGDLFLTDGGIETTLIFHQGLDLPEFAAFVLLEQEQGRTALRASFEPYLSLARQRGAGVVLDTPTWRANPDWGRRLGYDAEDLDRINRDEGYAAGDEAIKKVGRAVQRAALECQGVPARFSGRRIGVVIPRASRDEASS